MEALETLISLIVSARNSLKPYHTILKPLKGSLEAHLKSLGTLLGSLGALSESPVNTTGIDRQAFGVEAAACVLLYRLCLCSDSYWSRR